MTDGDGTAPRTESTAPPKERGSFGRGFATASGWLAALLVFCTIATLPIACVALGVLASIGSGDAAGGDAVAVIRVDGTIMGSPGSGAVTPDEFVRVLRKAEDNGRVKAIVLRVNCPGGTVAASEEIALAVRDCKKPVVVSGADVVASGAYMMASQSDEIVVSGGTAVGSIGVIMETVNYSKLAEKVGVSVKYYKAGKYKDAGSPFRDLTPEEESLVNSSLGKTMDAFIDMVAAGRKMERSKVEKLATGWAWTGTEAKGLGLVDGIGGLEYAVTRAGKLGKIDGRPDVITYDVSNPFSALSGLLSGERVLDVLTSGSGTPITK
jgi:protease-4